MNQGLEGGSTQFADDPDADTIELELTPEQVLALSHGAETAHAHTATTLSPSAPARPAAAAAKPRTQSGGASRFRFWPLGLTAAVVGLSATIAWWSALPDPADPDPPVVVAATPDPPAAVPAPPPPVQEQGPPVRVKNPFDSSEVFEFPAGTTQAEARDAVAELLMQRALERRTPPAAVKAGGRRSTRGAH